MTHLPSNSTDSPTVSWVSLWTSGAPVVQKRLSWRLSWIEEQMTHCPQINWFSSKVLIVNIRCNRCHKWDSVGNVSEIKSNESHCPLIQLILQQSLIVNIRCTRCSQWDSVGDSVDLRTMSVIVLKFLILQQSAHCDTSGAPDVTQASGDSVGNVDLRANDSFALKSTDSPTKSHCEHQVQQMSQMTHCWRLSWIKNKWLICPQINWFSNKVSLSTSGATDVSQWDSVGDVRNKEQWVSLPSKQLILQQSLIVTIRCNWCVTMKTQLDTQLN